MSKFRVVVPFQHDMGSIAPFVATEYPMETKEENALWHLNSMREHDGLSPLTQVPAGTRFVPIPDDAVWDPLWLCYTVPDPNNAALRIPFKED